MLLIITHNVSCKRLTLRGERIAQEFQQVVENYIEQRFGAQRATHTD